MAPPRDRRPGFSRRAQNGVFFGYILAIAGGVVGAVLLALSQLNPTAFSAARASVAEVTAPISSALAVAVDTVSGIPDAVASWWDVHNKNADLNARLARARPALVAGHLAQLENARLRRLLAVRDLEQRLVVTARIVSTSATSTRRYGLLNAGTWQGVREGQPVKAGDTLVRLDGELLRTELAIVEGQYFEVLARRGRLEAERAADNPLARDDDETRRLLRALAVAA